MIVNSQQLGIDIAKAKADVVLLKENRSYSKTFKNNLSGFDALGKWLTEQNVSDDLHICMEATGPYWEAIATYLHDAGYKVSVVNPVCIKAFSKSELRRTKTDSVDALVIARYCRAASPAPWTPMPAPVRELQALVRRLESLKAMHRQESNRLDMPDLHSKTVAESIYVILSALETQIKAVEQEIRDHIDNHPNLKEQKELLLSIPGIGEVTSALLLAEMGDIKAYRSARQLAAHAGLTPRDHESGSSIHGRARLAKIGNSRLRSALYMPALVSRQHNPIMIAFSKRLLEAGKPKCSHCRCYAQASAYCLWGLEI
jgi:transposase